MFNKIQHIQITTNLSHLIPSSSLLNSLSIYLFEYESKRKKKEEEECKISPRVYQAVSVLFKVEMLALLNIFTKKNCLHGLDCRMKLEQERERERESVWGGLVSVDEMYRLGSRLRKKSIFQESSGSYFAPEITV